MSTLLVSAFLVSFLAAAMPGPGIAWVLALSSSKGSKAALTCVGGLSLGSLTLIVASVTLLEGVTALHDSIEQALRWLAIAIMAGLGVYLALCSDISPAQESTRNYGGWICGWLLSVTAPAHILVVISIMSEAGRAGETVPVAVAIIIGDSLPMLAAAISGQLIPIRARSINRLSSVVLLGFAGSAAAGVI